MKPLFSIVLAVLLPITAMAQTDLSQTPDADSGLTTFSANEVNLDDFLWMARPLIIFSDTTADPRLKRQLDLLAARPEDLTERDVVVIIDDDKDSQSEAREKLHPRGFALVLIDKDGSVMLRKPLPWSTRELSRAIDKTPLRQQELLDARESGS